MESKIEFVGDPNNPSGTVVAIKYELLRSDGVMETGQVEIDNTFSALCYDDAVAWVKAKINLS